MTELWSEKSEWFDPSPIEPFNLGSDAGDDLVDQGHKRSNDLDLLRREEVRAGDLQGGENGHVPGATSEEHRPAGNVIPDVDVRLILRLCFSNSELEWIFV